MTDFQPDMYEHGGPRPSRAAGAKPGATEPQRLNRRLFMQLQVFAGAADIAPLSAGLEAAGLPGVLYLDLQDAHSVGLLSWSDDPEYFATRLRACLQGPAWTGLQPRREFSLFGRTYALGHEPDLEDWLLRHPVRAALAEEHAWAVWYPLRRKGAFSALPAEEQTAILREHGRIGHAFGAAGLAQDIRLACFGLDRADNDFIIGLAGRELHPLSACVQAMRKTRQTSQYIASMGPFFIGRAAWRSAGRS